MGFFSDKRRLFAGYLQGKGNIVKDRLPGKQFKILEDKTDIPAQQIELWSTDPIQVYPIYQDMTACGLLSAKGQSEERGLTRSAWPGYKNKFTFPNPEVQIIQSNIRPKISKKTKSLDHVK
jgi:hypothetical protein